jgi:hypothetical protein
MYVFYFNVTFVDLSPKFNGVTIYFSSISLSLWTLLGKFLCYNVQTPNNILETRSFHSFPNSIPGRGWEFSSSPPRPQRLWGPPSLLSNGYQGALSLGVKRPGREADYSPPSAEVKEWVELYICYPNTPSWRGAQLKHRDNLTPSFSGTGATRYLASSC